MCPINAIWPALLCARAPCSKLFIWKRLETKREWSWYLYTCLQCYELFEENEARTFISVGNKLTHERHESHANCRAVESHKYGRNVFPPHIWKPGIAWPMYVAFILLLYDLFNDSTDETIQRRIVGSRLENDVKGSSRGSTGSTHDTLSQKND